MSMRKHIAFASMCIGLFIAQLDIQIVSSSLNEIGGGLSAGKDEMAWLQTSYLIAEIIVIPLSFDNIVLILQIGEVFRQFFL